MHLPVNSSNGLSTFVQTWLLLVHEYVDTFMLSLDFPRPNVAKFTLWSLNFFVPLSLFDSIFGTSSDCLHRKCSKIYAPWGIWQTCDKYMSMDRINLPTNFYASLSFARCLLVEFGQVKHTSTPLTRASKWQRR